MCFMADDVLLLFPLLAAVFNRRRSECLCGGNLNSSV